MPLEFRCQNCDHLLRVPDRAAGKRAQCPACEKVCDVPNATEHINDESEVNPFRNEPPENPSPQRPNPFGPSPFRSDSDLFRDEMETGNASREPAPASNNPFASPAVATQEFGSEVVDSGVSPWPHRKLQAIYAFRCAWPLFKRQFWLLVGAFFLIQVADQFFQILTNRVNMMRFANRGGTPDALFVTAAVCVSLLQFGVQFFFNVGMVRIYLCIARGKRANIGMLFSGGHWFLRGLGASIIYWIMVVLGCVALLIPGIYLGLKYFPFLHFIVDQNCRVGKAIKNSSSVTRDDMGELLVMFLITVLMVILGLAMACVGILVTYPITGLAWTIGYLMLTGQPFYQVPRAR